MPLSRGALDGGPLVRGMAATLGRAALWGTTGMRAMVSMVMGWELDTASLASLLLLGRGLIIWFNKEMLVWNVLWQAMPAWLWSSYWVLGLTSFSSIGRPGNPVGPVHVNEAYE